ncbi:MAG: alpha/beta hydrolase [Venatoribacter sp.]
MDYIAYSYGELKSTTPNIRQLNYKGRSYKVEFQAFSHPENLGKTPVVFLGGAFQTFSSFRNEAELVLSTHPIILADFPSQGSNDQLAPELGLNDFAHLIEQFCQIEEINTMILLGISYGSALAMLFSTNYPARVERLLLSGITCFRRQEMIVLYEDLLQLLQQQRMEEAATTAVCNLMNHNRLTQTEVSSTYRRMLHRQIQRMNDNECARYIQNTRRILDFPGFTAYPQCPTLISTGIYDNFTQPEENAAVAKQCAKVTFALVENADHLAQYERKEAAGPLFHQFMCGIDLPQVSGIQLLDPHTYAHSKWQLEDEYHPLEQPYTLHDDATGQKHRVRINKINFNGCELELSQADFSLTEDNHSLYLALPETGYRYHLRILSKNKKTLRGLFIQREFKAVEPLLQFLTQNILVSNNSSQAHAALDSSKGWQ